MNAVLIRTRLVNLFLFRPSTTAPAFCTSSTGKGLRSSQPVRPPLRRALLTWHFLGVTPRLRELTIASLCHCMTLLYIELYRTSILTSR